MATRKDSENIAIIERLKTRHQSLLNKRVIALADIERLEKELAESEQDLLEKYGTKDLTELKASVNMYKEKNTSETDSYEQKINDVNREVEQIERS